MLNILIQPCLHPFCVLWANNHLSEIYSSCECLKRASCRPLARTCLNKKLKKLLGLETQYHVNPCSKPKGVWSTSWETLPSPSWLAYQSQHSVSAIWGCKLLLSRALWNPSLACWSTNVIIYQIVRHYSCFIA